MTNTLIEAVARAVMTVSDSGEYLTTWELDRVARAAIAAIEAAGYRIVPTVATDTMDYAGLEIVAGGTYDPSEIYAAMIAAAPKVGQ